MKSLEMVHPSKYADAVKMAQKFTAKNSLRMMLQMVYHRNNGDLIATDSYGLLKIKEAHGFKEDYLVNVNSLEFATGEFPDTDKLMPNEHKCIIRLNQDQIRVWLQMHKSMNQMSKLKSISDVLTMEMSENLIEFKFTENDISFKLPFEEIEVSEDIPKISYAVDLMKRALEAHVAMKSSGLLISMSSQFKPILLDNQSDVQAIVLPVRKY